jgi:hypothetical protein
MKDTPTAFPWAHGDITCTGMTLRDYFAAKAMQVVYEKNWDMFMNETFDNPEEAVEGAAKDAYELADAMLKARQA